MGFHKNVSLRNLYSTGQFEFNNTIDDFVQKKSRKVLNL